MLARALLSRRILLFRTTIPRIITTTPISRARSSPATMSDTSPAITENSLEQTLKEKFNTKHVFITDTSGGCGQSFEATIVSDQFEDLKTLARHRLVNRVMKKEIEAIHAWSLTCATPEEWEEMKSSSSSSS